MDKKRIISLLAFILGIFLIFYAFDAQRQIGEAKGVVSGVKHFFTNNPSLWNPIINFFGGEAQEKLAKYDTAATACFILGILLTIGGLLVFFVNKSSKKRN